MVNSAQRYRFQFQFQIFMRYPNFAEEKILWKQGFKCVAGLDEAGRGPLAGPVVAAAVALENLKFQNLNSKTILKYKLKNVKDSKKLSARRREEIYKILTKHKDVKWGVGIVSERVIDKINILEATKLAMRIAVKDLNCSADFLLIDGNFEIKSDRPQKSIIRGDQKVFSISAASIIAKVARDRIMLKYDKKYPQYGFKEHKGYPTRSHIETLKKIGFCSIHRKSFYPVKSLKSYSQA